jgi:hypothetical protein
MSSLGLTSKSNGKGDNSKAGLVRHYAKQGLRLNDDGTLTAIVIAPEIIRSRALSDRELQMLAGIASRIQKLEQALALRAIVPDDHTSLAVSSRLRRH